MSQDGLRQRTGDRLSPAIMLLHNLCTSCSDPLLFSFSRTRTLKRDFYIETPPFPLPKDRKDRQRPSAPPTRQRASSHIRIRPVKSDASSPAEEPPDSPSSSPSRSRWVSGATSATTRPTTREGPYERSESMATAVAYPSPITAFFGGLPPFSTRSLHYLFSEDEAAYNRKTLFPQSRELFLHPAQLYSPPSIKEPASAITANEAQCLEPPSPAISLPPIFTVDEIEAALFKQFPPPPPPSREGPSEEDDIPVPSFDAQYASYPQALQSAVSIIPQWAHSPTTLTVRCLLENSPSILTGLRTISDRRQNSCSKVCNT